MDEMGSAEHSVHSVFWQLTLPNPTNMQALEAKGTIFKPRYTFKRKEVAPGEFKVQQQHMQTVPANSQLRLAFRFDTADTP
jgi:hypothetical protein